MDYLKIGKATDLQGRDRKIYRLFEIFPGALSILTILILIVLSYFKPVWVAYYIIAFDIYWLLLVIYMAIFLLSSYYSLQRGLKTKWQEKCEDLDSGKFDKDVSMESLARKGVSYKDLYQLIIIPSYNESLEILRSSLQSLAEDTFSNKQKIIVLALEDGVGKIAHERAEVLKKEFTNKFFHFLVTFHPDKIEGELKGKGSNQSWGIQRAKEEIIDKYKLDKKKILVSVFDSDTVVSSGYFFALTYKFLSIENPYRASYQPIPVYHNNIWNAYFFSRLAASSNTFWQMIMQIRRDSLVTYSSHSMTYQALEEVGFWSTKMVSEDSRIFWNCLFYYKGDYRVEPLFYKVSMDVTSALGFRQTVISLYKQQRRWAWGSENIPYLLFNMIKSWEEIDRQKFIKHLLIQIYGFYSWATSAIIIAVIGWLPMFLGGDRFNSLVLSNNLPMVTRNLMNIAMLGLVLSAVLSSLLLPPRPKQYTIWKNIKMTLEWLLVPITIIFFGSIPCLDAQIRLLRGKYMGFWVTPKSR